MADNDKKTDDAAKDAQQAATQAEKSEEKAEDAAKQAEKSVNEAKEAATEVKEETKEEKKDSSSKASATEKMPKVSKKLEGIIGEVEKLSVLELSELVKALEVKFGVSAAPVTVAGAVPGANGDSADESASEQTTFNVIIADSGAQKISVIKAVRELVPTLGLKEAKDLVDAAPKQVLEGVNKEAAAEAKTKLESAGAKVELK